MSKRRLIPREVSEDATNLERLLAQIPQGRATCVNYARQLAITNEKYRDLIRDFDTNKKADLGLLCNKHSIEHATFLADIMREAYPVTDEALKLSHMISTGIVAAKLPKVVERGMLEAGKAGGITDRHFILQKEGFHVAPKGVNISMNQVTNAGGLPSFEDETRALTDILTVDGAIVEDSLLGTGDEDEYVEYEDEEEKVEA